MPVQKTPKDGDKTPGIVSDRGISAIEERRKALLDKAQSKQPSGLSIQSLKIKKQHRSKIEESLPSPDKLPVASFSEEEFTMVWEKYVQHLRDRGEMILASILAIDKPKINKAEILLVLPNHSMREDLEKSQGQVLDFLKRELNNYELYFKITVNVATTKKYVYTDEEKYHKLVEKNPAVETLRKTFDLGF